MLEKYPTALKVILFIPLVVLFIATLSFTILNYPAASANIPHTEIQIRELSDSDIARIISTSVVQNNLNRDRAAKILDSTIRIRRGGASGSGVIIFSRKHPEKDIHYTYIITNRHNVLTADTVLVDVFNYLERREIDSTTTYTAKVVQRSSTPDLALLEVQSSRPFGRVASFITVGQFRELALYDPVFICGCSLGKTPFITNGNLAKVEDDEYMLTAFAIFGNSGGGAYDIEGRVIGIVTQVTMIRARGSTPIGVPVSGMSLVIPSMVAAKWIAEGDYSFVVGKSSFEDHFKTTETSPDELFEEE